MEPALPPVRTMNSVRLPSRGLSPCGAALGSYGMEGAAGLLARRFPHDLIGMAPLAECPGSAAP